MASMISLAQFHAEAKAGAAPKGPIFRVELDGPSDIEGKPRTKRFCFSDGSIDRMGDTIAPDGWDLEDFERNPVALWAHDSWAPPIGSASNVGVVGERLMGDIEFAPPETYAFAETIFRLVEGRFIRAVSVGFLPLEYSFVENDPARGWGIDFKRQQLLEISLCPIPANPNALNEARAKGIDTRPLFAWAEAALDGAGKVTISRAQLERLRKAAKEPKMAKTTAKPRAGGANEDDPAAGGAVVGDCGRDKDEPCGMKDPTECLTHGGGKTDDDDAEKALLALLRRLGLKRRDAADGDPDDNLPLAHEDAIRMAHKCMRTAKSFQAEAMNHYGKAMDHLDGVVDALNDADPETDPPADTDPDAETEERARRAEARKRRLSA